MLPLFQRLHGADSVMGIHIAAGAIAHVKPVILAAAEECGFFFRIQRQRAVVFQQHDALRRSLTASRGHLSRCTRYALHRFIQRLRQHIIMLRHKLQHLMDNFHGDPPIVSFFQYIFPRSVCQSEFRN